MVELEGELTIGERGVSIVNISAKIAEGFEPFPRDDYTPKDAVIDDIDCFGIEDWTEYVLKSISPDEGRYKLRATMFWIGSADDAETDYKDVKLEPLNH